MPPIPLHFILKFELRNTNSDNDSHSSSDTHSIGESNQSDYIGDTFNKTNSIPFSCLYDNTPSTHKHYT